MFRVPGTMAACPLALETLFCDPRGGFLWPLPQHKPSDTTNPSITMY